MLLTPFACLGSVNPLLFCQLCLVHYAEMLKDLMLGVWSICQQTISGKDTINTTIWAHIPGQASRASQLTTWHGGDMNK